MRRSILLATLATLCILDAGTGSAAVLPFIGRLAFEASEYSNVPVSPISISGAGEATVNGSLGGVHLSDLVLPADAFVGAASVPLLNVAALSGLVLAGGFVVTPEFSLASPTGSASNDAGVFEDLSGAPPGGGVMPLHGVAIVCLFDVCSGTPSANLVVPLTPVGQGGTVFVPGAFALTVVGAPWTLGTASAFGATAMGFAHGPASLASSTAQAGGALSLVAPVFISTGVQTFGVLPAFMRTTLHFVPEPGGFVLLALGVALLGAARRRRLS